MCMIIKITNFSVGVHELFFENSVNELKLGEPFIDKVKINCMMDKAPHQIILNCKLTIIAEFNCDRCNTEYKSELVSEFSSVYLFNEEADNKDLEVHVLSSNDDKIDITEEVVDYAKLTLPMKNLCKDECEGLCTTCGINLNSSKCNCSDNKMDPVWGPLLKLKDKLN